MPKSIEAIYEDGVFKPLNKINLKEHERVEIKIVSKDEWHRRFNCLIKKIHKKASQYTSHEIENDIIQAIKETRKNKRVC